MGTEPLRILGHRGSPRQARENTAEAFRIALLEGADGFETDLRRLADGTIVLFHDAKLDERDLATMTVAELRGRRADLALLDDLPAFSPRATIVLEIKESGFEQEVLDRVAGWKSRGRVIISSFRRDVIATLARLNSPYDLGIVTDRPIDDPARELRNHGARLFFPQEGLVSRDLVRDLHAAQCEIIPWTVNLQRMWEDFAGFGVDGWITDRPAEAVAWRTAHTGS